MNLAKLITAVEGVIHDPDYTGEIIKDMINEAVLAIATGVMLPGKHELSPPLPDLYASDDVLTVVSTGYLSLPADFNRDMFMVVDSNSDTVPIEPSFKKFMASYADEAAGEVFRCSVNGSQLHYRDIPAGATTLTVHYYSTPDTLTDSADIPSCIPTSLHRDLIVGHVCKEIFNRLELGMAGQKVDTQNYENIFNRGLLGLDDLVGKDERPDYYDNTTDYI